MFRQFHLALGTINPSNSRKWAASAISCRRLYSSCLRENPRAPFDHNKQEKTDLTEKGKNLAAEKAKEFFDNLNPESDRLFFVTSNEARAIGTANIYRQEAKQKGFEIIKPENPRSKLAEKEGEGELRAIDALSLNSKDSLLFMIYSPSEPSTDWKNVDGNFKRKWEEARKIIEADDTNIPINAIS